MVASFSWLATYGNGRQQLPQWIGGAVRTFVHRCDREKRPTHSIESLDTPQDTDTSCEPERERENVITYNNVRRLGDGDRGWRWNEEGEWKMGNGMERGGMGNGELKGEVS